MTCVKSGGALAVRNGVQTHTEEFCQTVLSIQFVFVDMARLHGKWFIGHENKLACKALYFQVF